MAIKLNDNEVNYQVWYENKRERYDEFEDNVRRLIKHLLTDKEVNYASLFSRVKAKDSFIIKTKNEKYQNPLLQITDVIGVRIVVYTKSDVEIVSKLIEEEFDIDTVNSMNKADIMKVNEVGYLSVHYVAQLKGKHFEIPTFNKFKSENIKFEIQIRTVLQHAWAEIEHAHNYKYNGELPEFLKRKFNLLAGGLELIDNNFNNINDDLDIYSNEVKNGINNGNYDFKIDTISVYDYLESLIEINIIKGSHDLEALKRNCSSKIFINALKEYGVSSLKDLDELLKCEERLKWRDMEEDSRSHNIGLAFGLICYMYIKNHEKFNDKSNKTLFKLNEVINSGTKSVERLNFIIEKYL